MGKVKRKKYHKRSKRHLIVNAALILILFMTIGFATINANLGIIGNINLKKFSVFAENLSYDNTNTGVTPNNAQKMIDYITKTIDGPAIIYRWATNNWERNQNISTFTLGTDYVRDKSQLTTMDVRANRHYLKYYIEDNVVTDQYTCFIISDAFAGANPGMVPGEYCIKGDDSSAYQSNKAIILSAFGNSSYCTDSSNSYMCSASGFWVNTSSMGAADAMDENYDYCSITSTGLSGCANWEEIVNNGS